MFDVLLAWSTRNGLDLGIFFEEGFGMIKLLEKLLLMAVRMTPPELVGYPMKMFCFRILTRFLDYWQQFASPYPIDFDLWGFFLRLSPSPLLRQRKLHCLALPAVRSESVFGEDIFLQLLLFSG